MFAGWRNGQNPAHVRWVGLGLQGGHPRNLFFLPQWEKRLWNRKSSCCHWGKWGLGGVSPVPEAAIKAWTANNSHPVNLLKSSILSCRHLGKEIHFLLPLTLMFLFQTQANPRTAKTTPARRVPHQPEETVRPWVHVSFEANDFHWPSRPAILQRWFDSMLGFVFFFTILFLNYISNTSLL